VSTRPSPVGLDGRFAFALALLACLSLASCGRAPHTRYREADATYRACLEDPAETETSCEPLRAAREQAYEAYERAAERSWTCRNTVDGCEEIP